MDMSCVAKAMSLCSENPGQPPKAPKKPEISQNQSIFAAQKPQEQKGFLA
jgi:hypothetical protein